MRPMYSQQPFRFVQLPLVPPFPVLAHAHKAKRPSSVSRNAGICTKPTAAAAEHRQRLHQTTSTGTGIQQHKMEGVVVSPFSLPFTTALWEISIRD